MNKLITKINSFNNNSIDFEPINNSKNIYNIYNNTVDVPFHKFWFYLDNTKYINMYYDFSTLRFGINAKNNTVKQTIDYIKNIANHMADVFKQKNIYDNINIDLPIKETENYPIIISLKNKLSSFFNPDNNSLEIFNISNQNLYSIIFEISFIKVVKNNIQDFKFNQNKDNVLPNVTLKFYFNVIKIQQENIINLHNENIIKLNISNIPIPPPINNFKNDLPQPKLPFLNELVSSSNKTIFKPPTADELLNKKTFLKKINKDDEKEDNASDKNIEEKNYFSEIGKVFLEKKKSLKKVEVIKGDDDYISKSNKKHKKHKKSKKIHEINNHEINNQNKDNNYDNDNYENIENEFANFTK